MKSIQTWLSEYGESHQNPTNKMVHWVCVPLIFFSIVGLFFSIKLPLQLFGNLQLNVAIVLLAIVFVYYLTMSTSIAIGMLLFSLACLAVCQFVEGLAIAPLWAICIGIFTAAWIGQFWGHSVEGKKPSFLKDIQFLMIGPAWLMSFIYERVGISY